MRGMLKNHKLAKAIQECAWSQFNSFLEYKALQSGTTIVRIGRFEPSSRICTCGEINHKLTLQDRTWTCEHCNVVHDCDKLAAQNILNLGMKRISGQEVSVGLGELSS